MFAVILIPSVRPFMDGFSEQLASGAATAIHLFGGVCQQRGAVLSTLTGNFSMRVLDGCNGVNVVILLWAAILAYPASWKLRWIGLAAGLTAIQTLNLLRLISLFYLGQYNFAIFEFAHLYLWETFIILDAIVVFGIWTKAVMKPVIKQ